VILMSDNQFILMMSVIGCMIAFLLPYFKCMISKEKKKKM
jgi:hypothetical protein